MVTKITHEFDQQDERIRARFRAARIKAGFSQAQLSVRSGIKAADIHRMESGAAPLLLSRMRTIAAALGRSMGEFFDTTVEIADKPLPALDPDYIKDPKEKKLLAAYRALVGKEQRIVQMVADGIRLTRDRRFDPAARIRPRHWPKVDPAPAPTGTPINPPTRTPAPGAPAFSLPAQSPGDGASYPQAAGQSPGDGAFEEQFLEPSPESGAVDGAFEANGASGEGPFPPASFEDQVAATLNGFGGRGSGIHGPGPATKLLKKKDPFAASKTKEERERLVDDRNYAWMRDNGGKYPGQWVALRAGVLVDYDHNRIALVERLKGRRQRNGDPRAEGCKLAFLGGPAKPRLSALLGIDELPDARKKIAELEEKVNLLAAGSTNSLIES